MQAQDICEVCGQKFDPSLNYAGGRKTKGRPRIYCSQKCKITGNNAKIGLGTSFTSWPRSVAVEQEVCEHYNSGLSTGSIAKMYGVADMTVVRVLKRNGITRRSKNARTARKLYKGGRILDRQGYACVRIYPDDPLFDLVAARGTGAVDSTGAKYVPEHRLVMTRILGRPLRAAETVHHKNGIRTDNCPENLELWAKPHGGGQRVQDLIAFVVEQYPEAVRAALDGEQLTLDLF